MTDEQYKTQLTEREKVMSYIASRLHGVDQHLIAWMYGVNSGRVNEAVQAIEYAVQNTLELYRQIKTRPAVVA